MSSKMGEQRLWKSGVEGLSADTAGYDGIIPHQSRCFEALLVLLTVGTLIKVWLNDDILFALSDATVE